MMKTKKGKTRIKLKKLLLFLLMVVLAIALLVFGTEKIVHFATGRTQASPIRIKKEHMYGKQSSDQL